MNKLIHTLEFKSEHEIIHALQIAGSIAESAGLSSQDAARITTAISEIARNSYQYTGSGNISFSLELVNTDSFLSIRITDNGQGIDDLDNILKGNFTSKTGSGLGISSAGKLVDIFEIVSNPSTGTEVMLGKKLPDANFTSRCEDWLCNFEKSSSYSLLNLLTQQNKALIEAYDELRKKKTELLTHRETSGVQQENEEKNNLAVQQLDQKNFFIERQENADNNEDVNWNVLQSILDNTPLLVYVKDLTGKYLLSNKKYNEVLKYEDLEVIGKTDFDLVDVEKATRYHEIDQLVIAEKKPFEREEKIEFNGKIIDLLVTKFPLFDKNNEVYGIGGIAIDRTEREKYREELIEARRKAESAEQLQEQFLANMSHEIRTPMNGIIGMTNLIIDTALDNEQMEFVQVIKNSSDNLLVLINDILDISKIKAGKMNIEKIDFSLRKTIENTLASFRNKIKDNGLMLRVSVDLSVPDMLVGDPYRLNQILTNLISNALKFTASGEINLEVNLLNRNDKKIELAFLIIDTGIGIEADKLSHIFENFSQAEIGTTRKFGGTGLGLSITKQLVELQNGTIDVNSKIGEGSTFKVVLKYQVADKKNVSVPATKQVSVNDDSLFGKRVLIVEDNITNQKVVFHMLRKAGLEPDLADNGKEAIKLIENGFTYDLIIMDLQMPEMNGFETTLYIRNVLKSDIPIIAMTASALRNEKAKCLEIGMNEYLTKPFVPAELFKQLRSFLLKKDDQNPANENETLLPAEVKKPYNLNYLLEMEDLEFLNEVLQIFLDSTPGSLSEIRQAITEENWVQVYEKAHKLKSSLGIFQLNKMLALVSQIELDAKEKRNLSRISENLDIAEAHFLDIIPMFENEIENAKQLLTKI